MHPIRIRKTIDSETLYLPELKPLVWSIHSTGSRGRLMLDESVLRGGAT